MVAYCRRAVEAGRPGHREWSPSLGCTIGDMHPGLALAATATDARKGTIPLILSGSPLRRAGNAPTANIIVIPKGSMRILGISGSNSLTHK